MTHFWGKNFGPEFRKTNYTILILLKFKASFVFILLGSKVDFNLRFPRGMIKLPIDFVFSSLASYMNCVLEINEKL